MQICIVIIAASFFVAISHQACSTTDAHGIPSCAINAALDAGSTLGLLQSCQYNICCWCSDTNFTSQLNETWKGCSEADRDQAYQFFQAECNAQNSAPAAKNTTSSQSSIALNRSTLPSSVNDPASAVQSSLSTTVTTSSSSIPAVPTSLSSLSTSSTPTTSSSSTHTNQAATGRKNYNNVVTITFLMVAVSYFGV